MIDTSGFALPKPGAGKTVLTAAENTKLRKKLWAERLHRCHICRAPILQFSDMELDHLKQEKMGCKKDSAESNIGLSHWWCNRKRGSIRNV